MEWNDFCDGYADWAASTLRARISALTEVGNGEEIVDAVLNIADGACKAQLVRKAIKLGARFSHEDFMNLDGELPDPLYKEIAARGGFYAENPYFDENDFDWDEFIAECGELPEEMLLRCIPRIRRFGDSDEVTEAILSLSPPADKLLYERARAAGVKFTEEQREELGFEDAFFVKELKEFASLGDDEIESLASQVRAATEYAEERAERARHPKKPRLTARRALRIGALIGIFKGLFSGRKRHGGKCDGDCEHCPAHYGYRYGRWYYGHGHQAQCEFGGNGGRTGKTYRD